MKPYPEEKRKILVERSVNDIDDFVVFLEGVKGTEASLLQNIVTPPKGFSKNRKLKPNIRRSLFQQFISKLRGTEEGPSSNSVVWHQFEKIFGWWVKSQPDLFKIIKDFKNDADFEKESKKIVDPNSELDIRCFKVLLEANRNHQINKETIRHFYEYGYFVKDEKIEDLINHALTKKEIDHNKRLSELPDKVDELFQTIADFESRISDVESANELKQALNAQLAELSESLEKSLQKLNRRISELDNELNKGLTKTKSNSTQMGKLSKEVNSIKSRFSDLKKSVNSLENKRQTTESPRIAHQAVQIGKKASSLVKNRKRQKNEDNYLEEFGIPLWLLGITEPQDSSKAKAIHVALKAFSVIEITDPRIIDAWKTACGNNLQVTTLDVGMGWLDTQDWFPSYFSVKCFGEEMRLIDLDSSVGEMFNSGNQLWAIDIRNCDRSYPESYLPDFLRWIDKHRSYAKVFLTRCFGENCCNTSFEVYNKVGKLPKPTKMQSIEPVTLPVSKAIVDKSGWEHWCQPADEKLYQTEIQLLDKLQPEIENIPLTLLQDIRSYLLLSHQIFDPDKALDWALYLRLYPWLAGRSEIEDKLFDFIKQNDLELRRTTDALQGNL